MKTQSLEETLKKAQKKAADADTDPEAYRDRVLSAARQTMKASKTDSIEIDHRKGTVRFSIDKTTDEIKAKMEAFYGDKLAGFAGAKNRANDFGYFIADVAAGTEPFSCDCVIRTRVL